MSTQDEAKALKKLHARLVDTHNGYKTGIERAERPTVVAFFERFADLRETHIAELDAYLRGKGLKPHADGSWMTYIHTGIMRFRSAVGTLDRDIKDDVIEGEQKIVDLYEETIEDVDILDDAKAMIARQKMELQAEIDRSEPTVEKAA
jgi:uncharacterized protein (TIGR02284 family)